MRNSGTRTPSPALRARVLDRDEGICQYCGTLPEFPELDHVVPWGIGGPTTFDNLVTSCPECNRDKGMSTWSPGLSRKPKVLGSNKPVDAPPQKPEVRVGRNDPVRDIGRARPRSWNRGKVYPLFKKNTAAKRGQRTPNVVPLEGNDHPSKGPP